MPHKVRTVIESPFGRNVDGAKCTPEQYARNTRYLNRCILDSLARGEAPYASHRFFPGILDDTNPEQRRQGIEAGFSWGAVAAFAVVYIDHGITEGMHEGIARHAENGLPIEYREIGAEPDVSPSLVDRLVARLRSFVGRAAPLVRDGNGTAVLKIMLHQPGGDEDGTLYLEAQVRETLDMGDEEGRVPGLRFDDEVPL